MEINTLNTYFKKDYIIPTQEAITKFLEERRNLKHSSSMPNINSQNRILYKTSMINLQNLIYPTPQSSRIVLRQNSEVYKIIKTAITN